MISEYSQTSELRPPISNDHHFEVLIVTFIAFLCPKDGGRYTQVYHCTLSVSVITEK